MIVFFNMASGLFEKLSFSKKNWLVTIFFSNQAEKNDRDAELWNSFSWEKQLRFKSFECHDSKFFTGWGDIKVLKGKIRVSHLTVAGSNLDALKKNFCWKRYVLMANRTFICDERSMGGLSFSGLILNSRLRHQRFAFIYFFISLLTTNCIEKRWIKETLISLF